MIRMPTAPTPKDITRVPVGLGILEMEKLAKVTLTFNHQCKKYNFN